MLIADYIKLFNEAKRIDCREYTMLFIEEIVFNKLATTKLPYS